MALAKPCPILYSLKRAFRNRATLRVRSAVVTFPIEPKIRDRGRFGSSFPLPEALRGAGWGRLHAHAFGLLIKCMRMHSISHN